MRVTVKGQVTLPKRIRERHGIKPGTQVEIVDEAGRIVVRKETERRGLDAIYGILRGGRWKRTDDLIEALRGRAL